MRSYLLLSLPAPTLGLSLKPDQVRTIISDGINRARFISAQ